jgi:Family of unknown function (DUF5906)
MYDNPQQGIDELDTTYFVVSIKGKVRVAKLCLDGLTLMTERDFRLWEANKQYASVGPRGGKQILSIADAWLKSPRRRTYDGIEMVPGGPLVLPNGYFNIYRGWGVMPKQGQWPLMQAHIKNILANGDPKAHTYILRYGAWCLQNPDKRAEVALVLKGEKGAGKGVFGNALCRMFGPHAVHIANEEHLTGRFQAYLENCLFLFADEAVWGGGKKAVGMLQAMITEPTLQVEKKGLDPFAWGNRLHMVMAADKKWAVPAGAHERRYVVIEVSNRFSHGNASPPQIKAYFDALHKELYQDGGLEAMMWDLQQNPATVAATDGWHPREIYETAALRKQQKLGMSPLDHWWEDILHIGQFPRMGSMEKLEPDHASTKTLRINAQDFNPKLRDLSDQELAAFLEDQGAWHHRKTAFRGWRFMPLAQHRTRWEQRWGPREWSEPATEWQQVNDGHDGAWKPTVFTNKLKS